MRLAACFRLAALLPLASALVAAALSACAGDSFVSSGDGGASEAGAGDAGAGTDGASSSDGGGGTDSGDDASPSGPFCTSLLPAPRVCLDFDEATPTAYIDGFASVLPAFETADGGTVTIVQDSRTRPSALSVTTPSTVGAGQGVELGIDRSITVDITPPKTPHGHLRFDYKLDSVFTDEGYTRSIAEIRLKDAGGDSLEASFFIDGTTAGVAVQGGNGGNSANYKYAQPPLPIFGKWVTVDLDLAVTGTTAEVTVSYDGTPTNVSASTTVTMTQATKATFFAGLTADPGLQSGHVVVDDIVLTTP